MQKLVRAWVFAAALSSVAPCSTAHGQAPPESKSKREDDTFFSGNVVSVTADKLTVSRRAMNLTLVTRVFLLDSNTRVQGKLQAKARVTVKFEKTDDGDRAVHIIVR